VRLVSTKLVKIKDDWWWRCFYKDVSGNEQVGCNHLPNDECDCDCHQHFKNKRQK
jgi:hypothetical protein